jgi:hypothetical protein
VSRLLNQMRKDFRRLLTGRSSNRAKVTIVTNAADVSNTDPNLESTYPASAPLSGTAMALVHFIQPTTSSLRQFAEVQIGDVIVDFPHDAKIPAQTSGAKFYIEGNPNTWVQKQVGKDLAEAWDLIVDSGRVMRTFLLTKQP